MSQQGGAGPSGGPAPALGGLGGADLGVDYAWLQEQLAELGRQLGNVALEDEFEDEYEEWEDPSGGLLGGIFDACENDAPDALGPLLDKLKGSQWGVDTHGPDGDTPLHAAALYGSEACVELLLAAGARVAALNCEDGTTALHDAAAGGYTSIMRILVDAAREQLGKPAAAGAAAGGGDGAAEGAAEGEAAAAGGEAAAGEEGGDKPALPAAPNTLLELVNAADTEGETALHNAARGNHVEAVRFLLSLGADPFAAARDGSLPADEPEDEGVAAIIQEAMDKAEAAAGGEAGGGDEAGGEAAGDGDGAGDGAGGAAGGEGGAAGGEGGAASGEAAAS